MRLAWPIASCAAGWDVVVNWAYAYPVPDEGNLSDDAQKRLTAIQQFTRLRVGIPDGGPGNPRGGICSTNNNPIAAVGLDLYLQMVEQTVPAPEGQVVEESRTLPCVSASRPTFRKTTWSTAINASRSTTVPPGQLGDLALMHGEIEDRYGPPRTQSNDCSNSCRSGSWQTTPARFGGRANACSRDFFDPKRRKYRKPAVQALMGPI